MVDGLTNVMCIATTIAADTLLNNVVKHIETEESTFSEKLANRAGAAVISGLIGNAVTKTLRDHNQKMLEKQEKNIGIEVIGYIE